MAEETRRVTAEDVVAVRDVNQPHLSPDGTRVVFCVAYQDLEENKTFSHLWLLDLKRGEVRQFTYGKHRDSTPRWSPDGRWIAFLSNRGNEKEQHLWVIPADGGEARRVTDKPVLRVIDFDWAPDGRHLVFTAKARRPDEPEKEEEILWREVRRLIWKMDGEGWWDGRWVQVWRVALDGSDLKQLTDAEADHTSPRWSPDGRWIAFISKRVPDPDRVFFDDIFVIPAEGGEPRQLTRSLGPITSLAWSPDSTRIAYFGRDLNRGYNSNMEVWVVGLDGGTPRSLTRGFDRSVGDQLLSDGRLLSGENGPIWLTNEAILFLCSDQGRTNLYRVDTQGHVSVITQGNHWLYAFHARRGLTHGVAARSTPVDPGELVEVHLEEGTWEPRTALNQAWREARPLVMPEHFQVTSPGGVSIDAWLMKPPDFSPTRKYPLIVYIHGGPHLAYGWSWFHEFQYLVSHGYCLLYTNPRGSQSYGEAFNDAIRGNWGPPVQEDIEAAIDAVLAQGFVDPQRVGVAGGSFGGYMVNWLIGHSDRFAAAVTQRCVSNMINLAANDDVGHYFCQWEAPGCPWDNWEWYINHSPLTYVKNIRTPLLIIHSDQDHRCTIDQAEQLYRALRLLDREVEFVVFVGASHGLSRTGKPKQRVERLKRILGWFQKYMAP